MSKWKIMLLAGAMTVAPVPAFAQDSEAVAVELTDEQAAEQMAAEAKAAQQKIMDEMVAMIGKLFDTSDLPAIEPARLAPAKTTAAKLLPDGAMAQIMDNMFSTFLKAFSGIPDSFADMRLSLATGVDGDTIAALDPVKRAAIADLFDPHRKAREEQTGKLIMPFIRDVFAELEPPMRAGMARAYARRFNAGQLEEINSFFATPTGAEYAAQSLVLQADREVLSSLFKAIPAMLPKVIEKGAAMEKDIKALPKEKTLTDLSDPEMAKLAGLLGVPVQQLEEQRALYAIDTEMAAVDATGEAAEDAAEAAEAAADAAVTDMTGEMGEWTYAENWSAEDRAAVEKLQQAHADVDAALIEAESGAIERARIRMGGQPATAAGPGD